jgi:hypothetical protein
MNSIEIIFKDVNTVLKLSTILLVISQLLSSIEFCYIIFNDGFSDRGYCPWSVINLDKPVIDKKPYLSKLLAVLYSSTGVRVIIVLKLIFLLALLFSPVKTAAYSLAIVSVIVLNFLLNYRNSFGGDGSDQMSIIVLVALFIGGGFFSNSLTTEISIIFIALQSALSYTSAGIAKLVSEKWRSGDAVFAIFNTGSYGARAMAVAISKNKHISYFLSWNVIVMECLFPVSIVLQTPFILFGFLLWGTIFHLFNALIMGLNSFFWVFLATYPCILYLFYWLS